MSAEILNQIKLNNGKTINLVKGDITERSVDVIVNAVNSYLKHDGGVAAAVVRKGGQVIQQESYKIGFLQVGSAVITTAGKLSCKGVRHAVRPKMGEGDKNKKLRKAAQISLTLASEKEFKSISMPAISSGIFGFAKDKFAKILVNESIGFLKNRNTILPPSKL
jgi:O-acetyl-ADP-ribose deacetylase